MNLRYILIFCIPNSMSTFGNPRCQFV